MTSGEEKGRFLHFKDHDQHKMEEAPIDGQ